MSADDRLSLRGRIRRTVISFSVVLLLSITAFAEPYETIINNGDPVNRVDIAIVGDGYTAGEMTKYRNDVAQFVADWFAQQPYLKYSRYFNVHRIDVVSNESGADHPERNPPVFVDTTFNATYNCGSIQRLICVTTSLVNQVISTSLPAAHFDIKLVIVNDPEYGGSGGSVAVASTNDAAVELILHEVGHSFGLLADEYAGGGPSCNPNVEPSEPNATLETVRELIKWSFWIDPGTPVPTTSTTPALPGLYEGAKYCNQGLFRPTHDNKMRTLGRPFEQINSEQHVKRIYNFVSPIDSVQPEETDVTISTNGSATFSVATPEPLTHSLTIQWLVNGQPFGSGTSRQVNGSVFGKGQFTVTAEVSDPTSFVRNDPSEVLRDSFDWTLNIEAATSAAVFDFDGDGSTDVSVFRPNSQPTAQWWLLRSSDSGTRGLAFGTSTDVPVAADFTGDGKTDVAFWRPSTGEWFILRSEDDSFFAFPFGSNGDIPAPGDFDGDGKADPAVYRPSSGTWFIVRSSDGGLSVVPFGVAADQPIVADYDGDGKDDVGVYRAPDNQFWLLRSTDGVKAFQFGAPGDRTAVGDWTGDGKADVAFFRPSTSEWYVIRSEDDSFFAFPWGATGDISSPGDFDGDGKFDPAVWRPSDRTWYIFGTTSGFEAVQFGSNGDVPLPSSVSVQ
ncbi:MAG: hypothetical protein IPM63_11830 [Acidobacteriota bacterium]|nr:MAG: hypothetical protein IPM63_11830 [Acidobacteriota bacterium]